MFLKPRAIVVFQNPVEKSHYVFHKKIVIYFCKDNDFLNLKSIESKNQKNLNFSDFQILKFSDFKTLEFLYLSVE